MKVRYLHPHRQSKHAPSYRGTSLRIYCLCIFADYATLAASLNHFKLLRVVGKGAFGKVRIVERKDTGLTFALKYIRKDEGRLPAHDCP